jgi:formylglycine-generating enzyme required for sulfatase activity
MAPKDAGIGRSRIFISYRRADSEQAAGRLAEDLRRHFAPEQVFQDFASIDPGADFIEAVQLGLDTCAAVLVMIGTGWLGAADRQGRRRLDLPDDLVRHEVVESLKHPDVRVFPVLVGDANMPSAADLPEPLQPLTRRQAFPLTVRHWPNDVTQLVGHLKRVPGLTGRVGEVSPPAERDIGPVSKRSLPWKPLAAVLGSLAVLVPLLFVVRKPVQPQSFHDCDACPEMVVVPAGSFMMGSPEDEKARSHDEGPQHKVTIPRPFAVGKFEVSFDEWDACVAAGGCTQKPDDKGWGRGNRPVINVSWDDVGSYVRWLAKETGQRYRLLSEAEWEYAARAGTKTSRFWGDDPDQACRYGNVGDRNLKANPPPGWLDILSHNCDDGHGATSPVGSFEPNAFALFDTVGNALEWTQDCWNESYKGAPVDGQPWESGDCGRRAVRGGSWKVEPDYARSANRGRCEPGLRTNDLGFRLARTL